MSMSMRRVGFDASDFDPLCGIDGRKSIRVDRCPICGASTLPNNAAMYRAMGYSGVKDGHAYIYQNLKVTFCDDCLAGVGGVDIICRVLEASDSYRALIQSNSDAIIESRRTKRRGVLTKWAVGIVVALLIVGVCCLIWKPEDVFCCIGVIAALILVAFLQGASRR